MKRLVGLVVGKKGEGEGNYLDEEMNTINVAFFGCFNEGNLWKND